MIFPRDSAGSCPQCRGILIRSKDDVDRRWLVCCCCGAQFPGDWGENASPTTPNTILSKTPLSSLEINPSEF